MEALLLFVFGLLGFAHCGPPEVACQVPLSPEHGQSFLYQEGEVVKYVCEPGYVLKGKEIVRCLDGQWEDPSPACVPFGESQDSENADSEPLPPVPPPRPLFKWDTDEEDENQQESNSTADEMPLSDEARVRLFMHPVITNYGRPMVHTGRLQSATELEEEERKRSQGRKDSPPPVVYVRRTITPGKSEASRKALEEQYKTASLHMTGHDVEMVALPRAAVSSSDKGQQDEYLRQLYYYYGHYNYPRHASLLDYRSGVPVVMTLTESQLAWINSLHPELRDQYLKDLYGMRAEETIEGERAQAFLRRYGDAYDAYNHYYHLPYLRQPLSSSYRSVETTYDYSCNSPGNHVVVAPNLPNMHVARYDSRKNVNVPHNYYLAAVYQCDPGHYMLDTRFAELYCSKVIMEDPIANYDYTCHQSGHPFIKAPRLRNMHIARYDRRQNPNKPNNHYLTAIYRCNPGYVMMDTRFTELHCSQKSWIGVRPVCVKRG